MAKNSKVTEVHLIAGVAFFERDYDKNKLYKPTPKSQRRLSDLAQKLSWDNNQTFLVPGGWILQIDQPQEK